MILQKETGEKTSKFFTKKVAGLKRVCIFAVPITGSAGVERLMFWRGLGLIQETLNFFSKHLVN
jgi:hypothetical protein